MKVCSAEQVALEPKSVSLLCSQLVSNLEKAGSLQHSLLAVRPLKALLGKMTAPGKPPHMTVVHRPFAQVPAHSPSPPQLDFQGRPLTDRSPPRRSVCSPSVTRRPPRCSTRRSSTSPPTAQA